MAEPVVVAAITRRGSAAANGIAPSVMPTMPIKRADLPASRSSRVKRLLWMNVAAAIASGGTQIATSSAERYPAPHVLTEAMATVAPNV